MPDTITPLATTSQPESPHYLTKRDRHSLALLLAADGPLAPGQAHLATQVYIGQARWWAIQEGLVEVVPSPDNPAFYASKLRVPDERRAEVQLAVFHGQGPKNWRPPKLEGGWLREWLIRPLLRSPHGPRLISTVIDAFIFWFAAKAMFHGISHQARVVLVGCTIAADLVRQGAVNSHMAKVSGTPTSVRAFLQSWMLQCYLLAIVIFITALSVASRWH